MTKKLIPLLITLFFFTVSITAWAGNDFIYRVRANWVKIEKADPTEVAVGSIRHPYTLSADQMEAMMLSIKIAKKYLLKKDVEDVDVFNSYEARKFASYLADALARANNDSVVNFAIVHKRPLFIMRNDHISTGNIWMADDGLHFQFTKLFAAIDGDYEASTKTDKALRRAKTSRVSLEANEGQKLSYNSPTEIIMDPGYDFIAQAQKEQTLDLAQEDEALKGKPLKGKTQKEPVATKEPQSVPQTTTTPRASSQQTQSIAQRLQQLEELKTKKLITDSEYQKKRQQILSEL